ncbi:MAG TPA: ATP-dependent metallopeptidase FtsH/Yme1/Tma family protein, partial [Polyangiaceae bacterium]
MPPRRPLTVTLRILLYTLVLAGSLFWLWRAPKQAAPRAVPYSEVVADVAAGKVKDAEIRPDEIVCTVQGEAGKPNASIVAQRIPTMDERPLLEAMEQHGVVVTGHPDHGSPWIAAFWALLPFIALPLLFWGLSARAAGRGRPLTFGRSKAKLYDRSLE